MVDTLVSGASASRRVGSTPIIRTQKRDWQSVISRSLFIYSHHEQLKAHIIRDHREKYVSKHIS